METSVGQDHALETLISIRIALSQEASAHQYPRHFQSRKKRSFTNGAKERPGLILDRLESQEAPYPVTSLAMKP